VEPAFTTFHEGELAVQARAGVRDVARRVGGGIRSTIPAVAREFLRGQPMVVLAAADATGDVWASLLSGAPGFAQAVDERTVRLDAAPRPGDPLNEHLRSGDLVGLLAIEFATRRRMRLNGHVERLPGGRLLVHTREVYANCPKYIQRREWEATGEHRSDRADRRQGTQLLAAQQQWIRGADTFFIASLHPVAGADASHRGGNPGFVQVVSPTRLVFPDYAGNNMFNTLGNLVASPRAGLLFVDFERGRTLQLTGTAMIDWDPAHAAGFAGAARLVEFDVRRAVEIAGGLPLRVRFVDYSPLNPA
jgi:predicted pyridoxine 5'-phosphate oxidase superfamily flavin-nucleotide-binding protein